MINIFNKIKLTIRSPYKTTFNQCLKKQKRPICDEQKKINFPTKIDPKGQYLSMIDIKEEMMNKLGLEKIYKKNRKSRDHLLKYTPTIENLPARHMSDSFSNVLIRLGDKSPLRDSYVNARELVRYGRLLEDMDIFAVWVCHNHVLIPNLDKNISLPYTFVTIIVDKITFTDEYVSINNDVRLSGHVSWVGTSSIEVVVWVESVLPDGTLKKITRAIFLMAARNATNTKAAPVNKIEPQNDYEKAILETAQYRKQRREKANRESLLKMLPTLEEQKIMHNNFLITLPKDIEILADKYEKPPDYVWMDETKLNDVLMVFPENRNAHDTIFGGYLMRQAYESAIINVSLFSREYMPKIKFINDINFHKPVYISTILKMTTFVTYTKDNYVQLVCLMQTKTVSTEPILTNIFHYTFETTEKVSKVIPKTYLENLWYLLGKREFEIANNYTL